MVKNLESSKPSAVVKVGFGLEYKTEIVNNKFYISLKLAKKQEDVVARCKLMRNDTVIEEKTTPIEGVEFPLTQSGTYSAEIEISSSQKYGGGYKYVVTTDNLDYTVKLSPKDQEALRSKREEALGILNESMELNYTIADYCLNNGYDEVFVYFEEEDSILARMLCYALEFNKKVRVRRYLSNKTFSFAISRSSFVVRSTIKVYDVNEITLSSKYPILYIKMGLPNIVDDTFMFLKQCNKGLNILKIESVVKRMYWDATFGVPVLNLIRRNPGLRVVLSKLPMLKNKEDIILSENEKTFMPSNSRDVILRKLKEESPALTTNSFEGLGYSLKELVELLEDHRQYYDAEDCLKLEDYSSSYVNTAAGIRVTSDQPKNATNNIYIIGGCRYFGIGQPDDKTLASSLQRLINEKNLSNSFAVFNYGYFLFTHIYDYVNIMNAIPFKAGDILILDKMATPNFYLSELPHADMTDIFKRPHNYGEVYYDLTHHTERATPAMAQCIYDVLEKSEYLTSLDKNADLSAHAIQTSAKKDKLGLSPEYEKELTAYKNTLLSSKVQTAGKSGSIVMNCNPFTLGHRYLIESSAAKVDILYIFVVEEDKSFFPYSDRMDLVKQGTADLDNVVVLPSGKFIISSLTFTDYFGKQELQDRTIDPSFDVTLFARHIAPTLDIKVRFAGEEPLDKVTLQYNQSMESVLPQYGIEFDIIPRKEFGNEVISASRVRALLKDKHFDEISKIVPETTLNYLIEKFS